MILLKRKSIPTILSILVILYFPGIEKTIIVSSLHEVEIAECGLSGKDPAKLPYYHEFVFSLQQMSDIVSRQVSKNIFKILHTTTIINGMPTSSTWVLINELNQSVIHDHC